LYTKRDVVHGSKQEKLTSFSAYLNVFKDYGNSII